LNRAPLFGGADAARALELAARIAASPAALVASGPRESSDRYGGAALVAEALARAGRSEPETLRAAVRDALVFAPDRLSLVAGAGGLAIVLDAVDPGRVTFRSVRARLAGALAASVRDAPPGDLSSPASYDLLAGCAGRALALALAGAEPSTAFAPFAHELADTIEQRLTAHDGPELNLGVSHGIAGVLAALNLALPGERSLARRYVDLLLRCSHAVRGARRWGAHWRAGETPSARRAWCYQTVGIAAIVADRARIDRDAALYAVAADALAAVLDDPAPPDRFNNAALCHGDAGVASIAWSFCEDARFVPHAVRLAQRVLEIAGSEETRRPGFLDGALGIAQFLVDAATAQERRWLPLIGLLPDELRPVAPQSPPA